MVRIPAREGDPKIAVQIGNRPGGAAASGAANVARKGLTLLAIKWCGARTKGKLPPTVRSGK